MSLRKRVGLSVFALTIMLLGVFVLPSKAAYITTDSETMYQDLEVADNGHVYIHPEVSDMAMTYTQYLFHEQDIGFKGYAYESTHWNVFTGGFPGPAKRMFDYDVQDSASWGWLSDTTVFTGFYDIINTTGDGLDLTAIQERYLFPMAMEETTSVILESGKWNYGVFNVTDEEFIHLTIASKQDSFELGFLVLHENGTALMEGSVTNGDIMVYPLTPVGPGMYFLILFPYSYDDGLITVDLTLDAITPTEIPVGEAVEDVLPGSEYILDDESGAFIHDEKAPTAHTYKFSSNSTYPGRIRYNLNIPTLDDDVYKPFQPWLLFTSQALIEGSIDLTYMNEFSAVSDAIYYQSFQNETYYLTIIGMENVEYVIYHDEPIIRELPVNQEFYIENWVSGSYSKAYSFDLAQDSVLKLNSTEGGSGFSWSIFRVFDDGYYRSRQIIDGEFFENSAVYYIPAGDYVAVASANSIDASGHYEFNLGPVLDGPGSVSADLGAITAVRFDASALDYYNVSIELLDHQNVSVSADYDILNTYGLSLLNYDSTLGQRQNGVYWEAFGENTTSHIIDNAVDGFCIVAISPYKAENNTLGLPGEEYNTYKADYTITVEDPTNNVFNTTDTLTITASPEMHNFTLGDPGDAQEYYALTLTCPVGVWMNLSIITEDVLNYTVTAYQNVDGKPFKLPWTNYLDEEFTGDVTNESSFQFGSLASTIRLEFRIWRELADEGVLSIEVIPLTTNLLLTMPDVNYPEATSGAGEVVPMDYSGLLIGGAVVTGVVVIAAVVIVYLRRRA